jgi:hypothetical protein
MVEDHAENKGEAKVPRIKINVTTEAKSTMLHALLGGIAGWISFYADRVLHIGGQFSVITGIAILVAILYGSAMFSRKLFPGRDNKWWAGNGAIIFVIMWLVVGTLMTTL